MRREGLIPRHVREAVEQLGLRGPIYYVGTLNGEPGSYRELRWPLPSEGARA